MKNFIKENSNKETSFSQIDPFGLSLLILIVSLVGYSLKQTSKSKQIKKAENLIIREPRNYSKALEIFIGIKDWTSAADCIVKSPPGTQILLLRRLQNFLPQNRLKSIFLRLGDNYSSTTNYEFASSAYLLAEMPWRAAQTHIYSGNISSALEILNTSPVFANDRIKAVRNLAKYSYDNNKPVESARLLQSIGAEDEAVAVLIAAGKSTSLLSDSHVNQRRGELEPFVNNNSISAKTISKNNNSVNSKIVSSDSISQRSDLSKSSSFSMLRKELTKAQELIKDGKMKEAEDIINTYSSLVTKIPIGEAPESQSLKENFSKTSEAINGLQKARMLFKDRKIEEAQVNYSELLEYAGDLFPAEIFAEAGLAYEYEPADNEVAGEFFIEASRKAKTSQASQKYKERADLLIESLNKELPKVPIAKESQIGKIVSVKPSELCSVCKRAVGATSGDIVQCNSCKSVAHYPHMAEWLKIKGFCPVCRIKMTLPDVKKVALTE